MPLQAGTILNNRYRILSVLGQGGFGAVYRAADMSLKRPCAVKENLDISAEAARQFEKEALILANLSHPNLPRVLDHFLIPGQGQYLVMDFIEGEDLQSLVERLGPVSQEVALDWIGQIASALKYLHQQNPPVIHRDIKPANIRIRPDGRAFLVDFGLVKVYDPHLRTTVGARAVTPGYSPPEQYGQGNTDPRTDIYALAATLYTLLTGLEPQESVQRVVQDRLSPLETVRKGLDLGLVQAVARAMNLQPSQRYDTVSSFEQAITSPATRVVAQTMQMPPSVPLISPSTAALPVQRKSFTRKPWFWPVVLVGLVVGIILFSTRDNKPSSTPEPTLPEVAVIEKSATEPIQPPTERPQEVETEAPTYTLQPTYTPFPTFTSLPPTNTSIPPTNTSQPPPNTPVPPDPEFTASENMFCRDGPGPEYEDHTMVLTGETVPVIARWSNGWFLVGIDNPNTRTKCCWIGGDGYLNVSASSIQTINYLVDRITCQPK